MSKLYKFALALCCAATLSVFSSSGFAANKHNVCGDLNGTWSGKGELKWFFVTCNYDSIAKVGEGSPTSAEVQIKRASRNFLCPGDRSVTVEVTCDNGRVQMKDSRIDVAGNMSDAGDSAYLEGNIHVMYKYHPFKLSVNKV